jgi:hypothetical protein
VAINLNEKIQQSLRFPHYPHLHALITGRRLVKLFRATERAVLPNIAQKASTAVPIDAKMLMAVQSHYLEHKWAYIDGIFTPEFYNALKANWPARRFFEPPYEIEKSYNTGFKWVRGHAQPEFIDKSPIVKQLLEFLQSAEFSKVLTGFAGKNIPISCNSFLLNETYPGSIVIPHMDTPMPEERTPYINIVFFVDASDNNAGALSILNDNTFDNPIFVPPNMYNACIIYDANAAFYHGFSPMPWGKWRRAITSSFAR